MYPLCSPDNFLLRVHNRIPVILPEEADDLLLNAKIQDPDYTIRMLSPNYDDNMTAYAVSSQVNNLLNGNSHLIKKMQ